MTSCADWSSNSSTEIIRLGRSRGTGIDAFSSTDRFCDAPAAVYCLEQ